MTDTTPAAPSDGGLDLSDVFAHMDDRTRIGWDAAVAKAENQKLREENARLRNAQQSTVPPAGEPDA